MASPEKSPFGADPFSGFRLHITRGLDEAREKEARGDPVGALPLASQFFEETLRDIENGKSQYVPNAVSAARCIVRCLVKTDDRPQARKFLAEARRRLPETRPAGILLRARLREEEARLHGFEETLAAYRAQARAFASHPRPELQGHAIPLAIAARGPTRACRGMAAPRLAAGLHREAADILLGARSTDLRSLLQVLEAISDELTRLGSHREAARILDEARRRMDGAMAILRWFASPGGARCRPDPQAQVLRLCAAAFRRAGDTASAGYTLDRLSRLQPGAAAPGYLLLGETEDALRDLQAAQPHLQAGLHTPLKREELVLNLELQSHLLRRLGRTGEAQAAAREALSLYRPPERPPIQDEWYQRWLHRLTRIAGEYLGLRIAGTGAGAPLENLAAGLGRAALEVHRMEAGVAAELAGHILHRSGRVEASFHSFHRALETYSREDEEWETSEHPYEDDFLTLEQLAREEFALLAADLDHPRSGPGVEPASGRDWKEPPRRVEILMRTLYTPEEFRRWGEHDVEDYFAGFHPGPLDRDPEEVLAEFRPPSS